MHTIHDKKIVLDCGTAVATTSRIISGFGRSSLRRKPNTTSEELRAAVESTRPARNLEIYLWSRVLLDQRPGGTSPLFVRPRPALAWHATGLPPALDRPSGLKNLAFLWNARTPRTGLLHLHTTQHTLCLSDGQSV